MWRHTAVILCCLGSKVSLVSPARTPRLPTKVRMAAYGAVDRYHVMVKRASGSGTRNRIVRGSLLPVRRLLANGVNLDCVNDWCAARDSNADTGRFELPRYANSHQLRWMCTRWQHRVGAIRCW